MLSGSSSGKLLLWRRAPLWTGLLCAALIVAPRADDDDDGAAIPAGATVAVGTLPALTVRDAANLAAFTMVQGVKGCVALPAFLWYFTNSTSQTPVHSLDVYALDATGLECSRTLASEHPGYVRRIVDVSKPCLQVRATRRPTLGTCQRSLSDSLVEEESSSGARGRRLRDAGDGGGRRLFAPKEHQYMVWVAFMELLDEGHHVIHLDIQALVLRDLWTSLITPLTEPSRAGYDIITTCEQVGPGSSRPPKRGCSFNPGVMMLRNAPRVKAMVNWALNQWEPHLDASTHRLLPEVSVTEDNLLDMTLVNTYFRNCHRKPLSADAPEESLQMGGLGWGQSVPLRVDGENAYKCNSMQIITWRTGYLRFTGADCSSSAVRTAEDCQNKGIFLYHHEAGTTTTGYLGLQLEAQRRPWPPAPVRAPPVVSAPATAATVDAPPGGEGPHDGPEGEGDDDEEGEQQEDDDSGGEEGDEHEEGGDRDDQEFAGSLEDGAPFAPGVSSPEASAALLAAVARAGGPHHLLMGQLGAVVCAMLGVAMVSTACWSARKLEAQPLPGTRVYGPGDSTSTLGALSPINKARIGSKNGSVAAKTHGGPNTPEEKSLLAGASDSECQTPTQTPTGDRVCGFRAAQPIASNNSRASTVRSMDSRAWSREEGKGAGKESRSASKESGRSWSKASS